MISYFERNLLSKVTRLDVTGPFLRKSDTLHVLLPFLTCTPYGYAKANFHSRS